MRFRVLFSALAIASLCVLLPCSAARADEVTVFGFPQTVTGSTTVTFSVVSSSDLQLNIGFFQASPGISGFDTTDGFGGFTADLFANGTASGGGSFIESEPNNEFDGSIQFTSWVEQSGDIELTGTLTGSCLAFFITPCPLGPPGPEVTLVPPIFMFVPEGSFTVAGLLDLPQGTTGTLPSPEPSSLLLLGTGLLGLGPFLRRRFARTYQIIGEPFMRPRFPLSGIFIAVVAAVISLFSPSVCEADPVTYTYTGNQFTSFSGLTCPPDCAISGSFTVSSPIPNNFNGFVFVSNFNFTDGNLAISLLDPFVAINFFNITTSSNGEIVDWTIQVALNCPSSCLETFDIYGPGSGGLGVGDLAESNTGDFAENSNDPGTWSATPEPSSLLLLSTGLLGLGPFLRRWFPRLN